MKNIAHAISIFFGPIWLVFLIFALSFSSGLQFSSAVILCLVLLLFQFIIPFGYVIIAWRLHKVSSWDLSLKEERKVLFSLLVSGWIIALAIIYFYGNQFLFRAEAILLLLTILYSLVSLFWKISLHVGLCTVGAIFVTYMFDASFFWIYFAIPLVMWARYVLDRHTLPELIFSVLGSAGYLIVALHYLR